MLIVENLNSVSNFIEYTQKLFCISLLTTNCSIYIVVTIEIRN